MPLFGRLRYGPNSSSVERFITRLAALGEDTWRGDLANWIFERTPHAGDERVRPFALASGMPPEWEKAVLDADRAAEPDRSNAWLRASKAAAEAAIMPAGVGLLRFLGDRDSADYEAWKERLPGGVDPRKMYRLEDDDARTMRDVSDGAVATQAAMAMAGFAACGLVVRDRIDHPTFNWLYAPFRSAIPLVDTNPHLASYGPNDRVVAGFIESVHQLNPVGWRIVTAAMFQPGQLERSDPPPRDGLLFPGHPAVKRAARSHDVALLEAKRRALHSGRRLAWDLAWSDAQLAAAGSIGYALQHWPTAGGAIPPQTGAESEKFITSLSAFTGNAAAGLVVADLVPPQYLAALWMRFEAVLPLSNPGAWPESSSPVPFGRLP